MSDKKKKSQVAGDSKAASNGGGHAPKTNGSIAMQLLADPDFMNAVNSDLGSLVGKSSGYIESLPTEVQRRIRALKKQQAEFFNLESKFYEEVHALEVKYASQYESLWQKRHQFVSGEQEPTDEESDWKQGEVDNVSEQLDSKLDLAKRDATKGIPGFWLGALKAVPVIADYIKQYDEPILEFLTDIRVKLHPAEPQQNQSFELEFEFATNPHFTNTVLTKKYVLRPGPDSDTPLDYEGPEIISAEGCKIDWKAGKNVTVKVMKRKPKNKKGPKRVITETVKQRSFFGFFSPPQAKEGGELDEDEEEALHEDFELGHFIRERIVPRAVLYFTGEAGDDESDFEDGSDDGEEGSDDDDEDDELD